ncbi:hypothetical protein GDO86_013769 [Hymenochirus boettgeri]|uniref:Transmembrane protein 220 n=1 Tax=Hymenochirus boettgeri TaxID=247094 RepID=A0A8T2JRL8_9PIPI|nr:hypothetical protein GDO86_013769 [Hymenochirus boettgeri]
MAPLTTEQKQSLEISLYSPQNQRLWKACNILMFGFFSLAAYVQVNDPDAEIWITFIVLVCVIIALYLSIYLCWNSNKSILHEEQGRAISGLLIISGWLFLLPEIRTVSRLATLTFGGIRLLVALAVSVSPFLIWLYIYMNKEMRESWPQHCKTVI